MMRAQAVYLFKAGTEPTSSCSTTEEEENFEQKQEKERFIDRFKKWFGQDDH